MSMEVQNLIVRRTVTVDAPAAHVFDTFTRHFDAWWPRSHHIGKAEKFQAVIEPRPGGRWYERGDDGSECQWGHVMEWEPPNRVLLSWDLNARWEYQPGLNTEVEVVFVAEGPEKTRVTLEHRRFERYGADAEAVYKGVSGEGGWGAILQGFADFIAKGPAVRAGAASH